MKSLLLYILFSFSKKSVFTFIIIRPKSKLCFSLSSIGSIITSFASQKNFLRLRVTQKALQLTFFFFFSFSFLSVHLEKSAKLRPLRAVVPYVPCALRVLVPHTPHAVCGLVPYVPRALRDLLRCLVACSRASRASCPTCSHALLTLCSTFSRASRASCITCFHALRVLFPM